VTHRGPCQPPTFWDCDFPSGCVPSQHIFHAPGSRCFQQRVISPVTTPQSPSSRAGCRLSSPHAGDEPSYPWGAAPGRSTRKAAPPPSRHTAQAVADSRPHRGSSVSCGREFFKSCPTRRLKSQTPSLIYLHLWLVKLRVAFSSGLDVFLERKK